uniref:Uncharacterized protein n=1 Tax=Candidatus Kentrum sp. SD TaxID=2126332 RepID=A0A450Y6E9_9GAMM|nr:MAG: hypothetical protein BECKSD772F_GA0070984_10105 [Candidatus Kentron sp. SD]VFK41145.1 MAG: hypothetical protein BECKSD772E_GA0070983_10103 [Candidatus Kentron sp. SD]
MKVHGKNGLTRSLASLRDDKTHVCCHFERSEKSFIIGGDAARNMTVRRVKFERKIPWGRRSLAGSFSSFAGSQTLLGNQRISDDEFVTSSFPEQIRMGTHSFEEHPISVDTVD